VSNQANTASTEFAGYSRAGISAIFKLHPNFRLRYPKGHFWSIGTFCRSISNVTSGAIKNYMENHEHGKLNKTIKQLEREPEQLSLSGFF